MTDERLLVGFLILIAVGFSFGLTLLFFGFVVIVGSLSSQAWCSPLCLVHAEERSQSLRPLESLCQGP